MSIITFLETSLAGIRVLPFFGYSLRTLVPPPLRLWLEERLLSGEWLWRL
jgi:hypothetical protein